MAYRVVVLTNHFSGLDALRGLDRERVPLDLVISTDEVIHAKYKVSGAVDVRELGIPVYFLKSYNFTKDVQTIVDMQIDVLLVMGFQRLVPDPIIRSVRLGAFGFHGSSEPLPKGRGHSPINWELIRGRQRFLLFMFYLQASADSGNIVDVVPFDMNEFDTCRTVYYKVALAMRRIIERTVPRLLAGERIVGYPQKGETTFFPKRTPEDGLIDWSQDSLQIYNFVRALTDPYPGAFSYHGEKRIVIWEAQPFSDFLLYNAVPGTILEAFHYGEFLVKTGDGSLLVTRYKGDSPDVGECLDNVPHAQE
jgi:methionyl-tRNA formyltransferase